MSLPSASKPSSFRLWTLALLVLMAFAGSLAAATASDQEKAKDTEEKQQPKITEEILVVGQVPKETKVGTVSVVGPTFLDKIKPLDLTDVMRLMPASAVTFGNKDEKTLLLRGINAAQRAVLLLDGIPIYEPYYGTFDLKTVAATDIASIQVTKGPSSVLYGPNTLGGIVNVITRRPAAEPRLSFTGSFGQDTTWSAGVDGSYRLGRFALVGNAGYQYSKGFSIPEDEEDGTVIRPGGFRSNSDYRRLNLVGKVFYYPTDNSEILVEGDLFDSKYGMPSPLFTQKPRYWRFPEWDRSSLSAGGFIGLSESSLLRFRAYTVSYDNILDQFSDAAMTKRQFESTFDNGTVGAFALGEFTLNPDLGLKASLNFERDQARTQSDLNAPWLEYHQETYSAAVEGRYQVLDWMTLNAGVSLDTIAKFTGPATTRLDPLVGLGFAVTPQVDLHLSFAKKTRFPSMRALYSTGSGNPDLLTEDGYAWEVGGSYSGPVAVTAAGFVYKLKNMIDSVLLPSGFRQFINIGQASIKGVELSAHKNFDQFQAGLSYTYLDHKNITSDRPLDVTPNHSLSGELTYMPLAALRINVLGLFESRTFWFDSFSNKDLEVPGHFQLDATVMYQFRGWELFFKADNLLNSYFYTEPGFPWRGRYVEGGVRVEVI